MEPDEVWAYRARQNDELVAVKVLRHGTKRPERVLVRFVDDAFEGREEWVPPTRLKVLWDHVAGYRAREERWDRIHEAGLSDDDPRVDAAENLIEILFGQEDVAIGWRESGSVRISDPDRIAAKVGLKVEQLTQHPLAFIEDGELIAPWEVTELLAKAAARRNPNPVLQHVEEEERKAAYEAIHGRWSRGGRRSNDHYFEPEFCARWDNERYRPIREILRSWCGADAVERFDELAELRKEIRRVASIAQKAIDALRSAGHEKHAVQLSRELGTPVEALRNKTDTD